MPKTVEFTDVAKGFFVKHQYAHAASSALIAFRFALNQVAENQAFDLWLRAVRKIPPQELRLHLNMVLEEYEEEGEKSPFWNAASRMMETFSAPGNSRYELH